MKYSFILVVSAYIFACQHADGEETTTVSFRSDIAPMLVDNCLACHGPKKAEGGFRVDTYDELLKPGDSGESPIAAADQESELLRRLVSQDPSERMPAESDPLTATQIGRFENWISSGGKFDGEKSNLPLALVIPPVHYANPPEVYRQSVPVTAAIFTPDGQEIVSGGYHELLVWNVMDGKLVRRIPNIGQRVFAMAFFPNGNKLAVGCGEPGRSGEVRLVNFESGNVDAVLSRINDVVLDLAFRPGTSELAIASADSTIHILDVETLQDIRTIASHADWVTAIAWSDDGTRLASASRDKSAKVYDGATGELITSFLGHGAAVRGITLLADNKQVVSVGADNKLLRWEIEGGKKVAEVGIGSEGFKLMRRGTNVFVPCADKRLLRIDLGNNSVSQEFKGHADWVLTSCLRADESKPLPEQIMASGGFDGELRIWNLENASAISHWIAKP